MAKQKSHIILYAAGLILLGLTAYIMLKTYSIYSKRIQNVAVIQTAFDNLTFCRTYELSSEGYHLPSETMLTNEDGDKILFSEVISGRDKMLVYRFSKMNCMPCIAQHLEILKSIIDKDAEIKPIVLSDFHNTRDLKILRNTHGIPCKMYSVDHMNIPMEDVNNPYFFIITKDMRCEGFFAAFKETPQQTESYLHALMKKL